MHLRKTLLWTIPIFSALLLIQSNTGDPAPSLKLDHQTLQNHTWIRVDDHAQNASKGHQTRKIVFTRQGRFEIRETFKFSGSTFKNPGIYTLHDSIISLKTFDEKIQIGQIRLRKGNQLRIEWMDPKTLHGKGVEIYRVDDTSNTPGQKTFTSRVFQAFHMKRP